MSDIAADFALGVPSFSVAGFRVDRLHQAQDAARILCHRIGPEALQPLDKLTLTSVPTRERRLRDRSLKQPLEVQAPATGNDQRCRRDSLIVQERPNRQAHFLRGPRSPLRLVGIQIDEGQAQPPQVDKAAVRFEELRLADSGRGLD